uniref:Uncharacterized protein n=1 Tax=Tetradesmus obliquus TaxID=3088 RepID=A0A383WNJ3_TETOB|eukprot:jgi/Sobl393_1/17334/SZX78744.1
MCSSSMALLKSSNLPGQQGKVSTTFFALAPFCSRQVQPVTGAAKAISEILDAKGLEAFHRLHQRAQHASCDFWHLLWGEGAAAWEVCIKQSFAAGMSLGLEEATVKYQGTTASQPLPVLPS